MCFLSFQSEWAPGMVGLMYHVYVFICCVCVCVVCVCVLPNDEKKANRNSHMHWSSLVTVSGCVPMTGDYIPLRAYLKSAYSIIVLCQCVSRRTNFAQSPSLIGTFNQRCSTLN